LASQREEGVQNAIELSQMRKELATLGAEYEHVSKSYGQAKDDCCITYKKLLAARKEINYLASTNNQSRECYSGSNY
jgi:hypothetical protein